MREGIGERHAGKALTLMIALGMGGGGEPYLIISIRDFGGVAGPGATVAEAELLGGAAGARLRGRGGEEELELPHQTQKAVVCAYG